jgi:molybdenum cofactor cytidylyltransferase
VESFTSSPPLGQEASVAGLVLASGMSRRFGWENKLLMPVEGVPVVRRTVEAYLTGHLQPVFVILGYEAELVESVLSGLPLTPLLNPEFGQGQSRALRCGVQALPSEIGGAVIGVADQPYLTGEVIRQLVERYRQGGAKAVVPCYGKEQGGPVLFDRSLFPELLQVRGDRGGRSVLQRYRNEIDWVHVPDVKAAADIDTIQDYERLTDKDSAGSG